ncbi:MAG: hypothetical protein K0S44_2629 [Bacteroidetes bacterium]|nr:hypothetical protein [Bacteroidota bacterium]
MYQKSMNLQKIMKASSKKRGYKRKKITFVFDEMLKLTPKFFTMNRKEIKSILLFILVSILSLPVFAQNYSIDKGQEFLPPDASRWGGFSGENDKSFFILRVRTRGRGNHYYIESINKATRQKDFEVEMPLEEESGMPLDPNNTGIRVFCAGEQIFVCFSGTVKDETRYYLKTLYADGKLGPLTELYKSDVKVDLNFYQSPDKTKILSITERPWINERQNVEATMYEAANFKKIWTKNLPIEFKGSPIETYYYNVDNSGNLYFLLNYIESEDPRVIGIGMGILGSKSEKAKIVALPNKNHYNIENGRAMIAANGKFVFTGIYKNEIKKDEAAMKGMSNKEKVKYQKELVLKKEIGTFSFLVDNNTFEVVTEFQKFPDDVAAKLAYGGGLLTEGAANKYYVASKLIEAGGDFYLVENHKYTITGDGVSTYEREFIVSKINSKGSIAWTKIFPKNTVNNLNTFNVLVRGDNVHLFYLEHPANLENSSLETYVPEKYKEIKNYNGSAVVALEISSDGSAKRTKIFDNKGWCYDPQPFNILIEKDNSLLMRMINRDKERFDVIKVN